MMYIHSLRVGCRRILRTAVGSRSRRRVRPGDRYRGLLGQSLEHRRLMVAEGAVFQLNQSFSSIGLLGPVSASVDWGDGTRSPATVTGGATTSGLSVRFDYRYDTGFFTAPRRQLLQTAADAIVKRFSDSLDAITPSGQNTWQATFLNPANGQQTSLANLNIAANEILIFAGARDLASPNLGTGGTGGWSASGSQAWLNAVGGRGEAGAIGSSPTDIGPWGGSVTFDSNASWYFGVDPAGQASGQNDFLSVATHELIHVLGFGTTAAYNRWVSGNTFTGGNARAANGGVNVPLNNRAHIADSVISEGQQTLLSARIATGTRKLITPVDLAILEDMGWTKVATAGSVTASHVYGDDGVYPITVTVNGGQLGSKDYQSSVTVTNIAPTISVTSDRVARINQPITIVDLARFSDPAFPVTGIQPPKTEPLNYVIQWGDGQSTDGLAAVDQVGNATRPTLASTDGTHTYTAAGVYTVNVRVIDDNGGVAQASFRITVTPPPMLTLTLDRTIVDEDDGQQAATLTVRRTEVDTTNAVTINFVSSLPSVARLPASIVMDQGVGTVTVPVQVIDDDLLTGDRTVRLTATGFAMPPATVDLLIRDREFLTAQFNRPYVIEGTAAADVATRTVQLTVRRGNTNRGAPLTVAVAGGDAAQLPVPPIVIPPNAESATVTLTPVDDAVDEVMRTLNLRLTAAGYVDATATVDLLDDDQPLFQNPEDPLDVDGINGVTAQDALLIINELNRSDGDRSLTPQRDSGSSRYYDVTGDYRITALDALRVINGLNRRDVADPERRSDLIATSFVAATPPPMVSDRDFRRRQIDQTIATLF